MARPVVVYRSLFNDALVKARKNKLEGITTEIAIGCDQFNSDADAYIMSPGLLGGTILLTITPDEIVHIKYDIRIVEDIVLKKDSHRLAIEL